MAEEMQFVDAETYRGNSSGAITFREIILSHFQRVMRVGSQELRGGYFEERPLKSGTAVYSVYVPDTREEYFNAVNILADSLLPHFDERMKKAELETLAELDAEKKKLKASGSDVTQEWAQAKCRIQRKMFRALSEFLHRLNYLEAESYEETI
jgi:hypothetical protein